MTLNLDARQRAMLLEMGYTAWWPQPATPEVPTTPAIPATREASPIAAEAAPTPPAVATPPATPTAPPASTPASVPSLTTQSAPLPTHAPATNTELPTSLAPPAFALGAPVPLFDVAPPGASDTAPGWLVIAELPPAAGLASPRGELLRNLLRAMGLAHTPRLWWVPLLRARDQDGPFPPDNAASLVELVRDLQPGMALLMGLPAARHLLESSAPLGQLRGHVHHLPHTGTPAVVSHDLAYLLRTPRAKADTWADACLALEAMRHQK